MSERKMAPYLLRTTDEMARKFFRLENSKIRHISVSKLGPCEWFCGNKRLAPFKICEGCACVCECFSFAFAQQKQQRDAAALRQKGVTVVCT